MFTGIITAIGTITAAEERAGADLGLTIRSSRPLDGLAVGASIACAGVCLTVVSSAGDCFSVDVSAETLARTAPRWRVGQQLNLERALRVGDELGGHIVTGHVDGVGRVASLRPAGGSTRLAISAPAALAPLLAGKGSLAVDGVSLTVNEVADAPDGRAIVQLNIIPHTASVTTLSALAAGDCVNLEVDLLARYLARLEQLRPKAGPA